uniref:Transposase n=1 Tax=Rodentolepis nana TaxID=102285 RepID=A0A0R3TI07_RODNA
LNELREKWLRGTPEPDLEKKASLLNPGSRLFS